MPFSHFRGTGQGAESRNPGIPGSAGNHADQLVTDETGIIFIAFDHFSADQFSCHYLKQPGVHPGIGLPQQVGDRFRSGQTLIGESAFLDGPQAGKHSAGVRQLVIRKIIRDQFLLIQQLHHFLVKAG